jgi:RNA polymerase sigma-70 factor (ECF subfamily)
MKRLSPAELDDERRLIEAAQEDGARFGELYERYVDAIYSFSYHQTGSHPQAEEVTAETFERALKHLPGYRWRGVPYGALLYRIAASVVSRQRRRAPFLELREAQPSTEAGPEEAWLSADTGRTLHSALARLPEDQRTVLLLRFEGGMRNAEIARVLGRTEGAVKALTFRAITALRGNLSREEVLG